MKFTVRLREIAFYEFEVEAESCKQAFNKINKCGKASLTNDPEGIRYEIESIILGGKYESREPVDNCA